MVLCNLHSTLAHVDIQNCNEFIWFHLIIILGPVLANTFIVELEQNVIPTLSNISLLKRYVDDIICFLTFINKVNETWKSYYKNIKFTIEIETVN